MKKIFIIVGIILALAVVGVVVLILPNQKPIELGIGAGNGVAKSIDLSNKGLSSIPLYVFNQTDLEELNVSHNSLAGAIQSQISNLKNLKILDASYNNMTGVPAEIGQLQNLEVLDLSYNQLTGLPNELGNLQKLSLLNLTGNNYSQQDLNYIHSKLPISTIIIVK